MSIGLKPCRKDLWIVGNRLNPLMLLATQMIVVMSVAAASVAQAAPKLPPKSPPLDPCVFKLVKGKDAPNAAPGAVNGAKDPVVEFKRVRSLPAKEREQILLKGLDEIEEFRFIAELAKRKKFRAWLMGGAASSFGVFRIDAIRSELGDPSFYPERFEHPRFMDIFSSTQDFDIVIDRAKGEGEISEAEVMEFQNAITTRFPYQRGKSSAWEVRLLRQKLNGKAALLDNPDFLGAHNDTYSTALIELTQPREGEHRYVDLTDLKADWQHSGPASFEDIWDRKITYLFSETHEETERAMAGKNPPIFSVIRYLTKFFRDNLEPAPGSFERIDRVSTEFSTLQDLTHEYAVRWLSWAPKKLMQSPADLERAVKIIDSLGIRKKLLELANPKAREVLVRRYKEAAQSAAKAAAEAAIDARFEDGDVDDEFIRVPIPVRAVNVEKYTTYLNRLSDLNDPDSMLSWLLREPLKTYPLGKYAYGSDARLKQLNYAAEGKTAGELGIKRVTRVIPLNHYTEFELLQRGLSGIANVFLDPVAPNSKGIEMISGYRVVVGEKLKTSTATPEIAVEFVVEPEAREGVDFVRDGNRLSFVNRAALHPDPDTLHWPIDAYIAKGGLAGEDLDEGYWRRYERGALAAIREMPVEKRRPLTANVSFVEAKPDALPDLIRRTMTMSGGWLSDQQIGDLLGREDVDGETFRVLLSNQSTAEAIQSGDRFKVQIERALKHKATQIGILKALFEQAGLIKPELRREWIAYIADHPKGESTDYLGAFVKSVLMSRKALGLSPKDNDPNAGGPSPSPEYTELARYLLFKTSLIDRSVSLAKVPVHFWGSKSPDARALLDYVVAGNRDYSEEAALHLDDNVIRKVFASGILKASENDKAYELLKTFVMRPRGGKRDLEISIDLSLIENLIAPMKTITEAQGIELVQMIIERQKASDERFSKRVGRALWGMIKKKPWMESAGVETIKADLKGPFPDDGTWDKKDDDKDHRKGKDKDDDDNDDHRGRGGLFRRWFN